MSSNNQAINKGEGPSDQARVSDSTINQQEVDLDKLIVPRGKRTTSRKRRSSKLVGPFTNPAHSEESKETSPLEAQSSPKRVKEQNLDETLKNSTHKINIEPQTENEKNGGKYVTTTSSNIKDVETNVSTSEDTTSKEQPMEEDPKGAQEKSISEDEEEGSQSLEVVEINEETESEEVVPKRTQSVADRVKRNRGKNMEIPKSYLKEKSQKRKRKPESSSEFEPDVEDDVPDIMSKKRKAASSTSFHTEDRGQRWKIVVQRRIATERELSTEALSYKEIITLLEEAKVVKTVMGVGRCYEKLVREFITNLTEECTKEESDDYHKVQLREKNIDFSPTTINKFLGRSVEAESNKILSMDKITEEITSGQAKQWPKKGLLPTSKLTVKYAILNRIDTTNWAPTNHSSGITPNLAKLIYIIGTGKKLDFGKHVFEQTMKHVETNATKLPIAFPSLITEIILSQQPSILLPEEYESRRPPPISFNRKLFGEPHVPDIEFKEKEAVETSAPLDKSSQKKVLAEFIQVSKELDETIKSSTIRKTCVDHLILQLTKNLAENEGDAQVEAEQEEEEEEEV
ncbi:hypothetical protein QL285_082691 [Trifolium repens]|nr:hypothetical protein QL285_082691 [Trifolium repens]